MKNMPHKTRLTITSLFAVLVTSTLVILLETSRTGIQINNLM